MKDYIIYTVNFFVLFQFCRIASVCYLTVLNSKFYITIPNKKVACFFIFCPVRVDKNSNIRNRMGILGVMSWVTLLPSAMYLWVKDGCFSFLGMNPSVPFWFQVLFVSLFVLVLIDGVMGEFSNWFREAQKRKKPAPMLKNARFDGVPLEQKEQVEQIFYKPDKIICDEDQQEYYYIRGKDLLRFGFDGVFISLTPEADSRRVLMAMRTGRLITFP